MMQKKFYEFKNITSSEADLFIYGEIVQENEVDWWTGEKSQTAVGLMDFKEELDAIGNVQNLNIYINSPGGDVFTASTMISMLQRVKDKGTVINAYIDGLSASAASFLMMIANNIYVYKNSTVMVHKPMSIAIGNANDMQKTIDALNKIEDSVMIPMYMSKAKASEEEIKGLIDAETWLSAKEMDKYFNVTLIDEEKVAVASIKSNLFKNYKNIPEFIKNSLENEEKEEKAQNNEENCANSPEITQNNEENCVNSQENSVESTQNNELREQEIKARLGLVRSSLLVKEMKEKEGK